MPYLVCLVGYLKAFPNELVENFSLLVWSRRKSSWNPVHFTPLPDNQFLKLLQFTTEKRSGHGCACVLRVLYGHWLPSVQSSPTDFTGKVATPEE